MVPPVTKKGKKQCIQKMNLFNAGLRCCQAFSRFAADQCCGSLTSTGVTCVPDLRMVRCKAGSFCLCTVYTCVHTCVYTCVQEARMYPDARCPQRLGQYSDLAADLAPPAIQGHLGKLSPGNFVLVGDGSVDRAQLWFSPDHAFKAVVSDGTGAYGSIEQELNIYTIMHMQVIARLATHNPLHSSGRTTVDTPAGE